MTARFERSVTRIGRGNITAGRRALRAIEDGVREWRDALAGATTPQELRDAFRRGYLAFTQETAEGIWESAVGASTDALVALQQSLDAAGLPAADLLGVLQNVASSRAGYGLVADAAQRIAGGWSKTPGENVWTFDPYAVERQFNVLFAAASREEVGLGRLRRDLSALVGGNDIDYARYGLDRTDLTALRNTEYRARRLAATETVTAARDSLLGGLDQVGVVAATWTLSPFHPEEDECDDLAGQMFPLEEWPDTHPFCMCQPGPPFEFADEAVAGFPAEPGDKPPPEEPLVVQATPEELAEEDWQRRAFHATVGHPIEQDLPGIGQWFAEALPPPGTLTGKAAEELATLDRRIRDVREALQLGKEEPQRLNALLELYTSNRETLLAVNTDPAGFIRALVEPLGSYTTGYRVDGSIENYTAVHDWSGAIRARPDIDAALRHFLAGGRTPQAWDAVHVALHELEHGVSAITQSPMEYRFSGVFWEEGITETRARQLLAAILDQTPLDQLPEGWLPKELYQTSRSGFSAGYEAYAQVEADIAKKHFLDRLGSYRFEVENLAVLEKNEPGILNEMWAADTTVQRTAVVERALAERVERELTPLVEKWGPERIDPGYPRRIAEDVNASIVTAGHTQEFYNYLRELREATTWEEVYNLRIRFNALVVQGHT